MNCNSAFHFVYHRLRASLLSFPCFVCHRIWLSRYESSDFVPLNSITSLLPILLSLIAFLTFCGESELNEFSISSRAQLNSISLSLPHCYLWLAQEISLTVLPSWLHISTGIYPAFALKVFLFLIELLHAIDWWLCILCKRYSIKFIETESCLNWINRIEHR